jgi:hypothetical protein
MAVRVALARAVSVRGGEPKVSAGTELARTLDREAQQRIDALLLELRRVERRGPPDVRAGLEDEWRGLGRLARREQREVLRGSGEAAVVEGIEPRAQLGRGVRRSLYRQRDQERGEHAAI